MRILIDMNLTPRWVNHLRDAGYDATHWSSISLATAIDHEICERARGQGYLLLTNDLDSPLISAHTRQARPSVMLLRGEPLVPEVRGPALLRALEECRLEPDRGAVVSLDWSGRPRARVLPLG